MTFDFCHCRAGCLATITAHDTTVLLPDGYALIEHVNEWPVEQLVLDVEAVAL